MKNNSIISSALLFISSVVLSLNVNAAPTDNYTSDTTIICYGDSVTRGTGADDVVVDSRVNFFDGRLKDVKAKKSYPYWLSGFITEKYNVIFQGIGGAFAGHAAAWSGEDTVKVTRAFTLPKTGSVTVTNNLKLVNSTWGSTTKVIPNYFVTPYYSLTETGNDTTKYSVEGTLDGVRVRVKGEGSLDGKENAVLTITALDTLTAAKAIPVETEFIVKGASEPFYRNAVRVYCVGGNDWVQLSNSEVPSGYSSQYDYAYEEHIKPVLEKIKARGGKYLIVSPCFNPDGNLDSLEPSLVEAKMMKDFGNHYLNVRLAMASNAVDIAERLGDRIEGKWTNNGNLGGLRSNSDNVHLNSLGYKVKAYIVRQKLIELGYVTVVDKPPVKASFWYDGNEKSSISEGAGYIVSGDYKATEPGKYRATVTLKDGYTWVDGTAEVLIVDWEIKTLISGGAPVVINIDPEWGYVINNINGSDDHAVVFTKPAANMAWTVPANLKNVQFLVVGGGGGGGASTAEKGTTSTSARAGAGGGGGGVVTGLVNNLTKGATVFVTVGAGSKGGEVGVDPDGDGGSGVGAAKSRGGDSLFKVGDIEYIKAIGGGRDLGYGKTGGEGGSDAGSRINSTSTGPLKGAIGESASALVSKVKSFGNKGGTTSGNNYNYASGGGGGATKAGGNVTKSNNNIIGGIGGWGLTNSITGVAVVYGSGGGGGSSCNLNSSNDYKGWGGSGGNGAGDGGGGDAWENRGGGGGGGHWNSYGSANGGNGGSGIVVFRFTIAHEEWTEKPSISDKIFNKGTVVTVNNGVYEGRTVTANYTADDIAALEPGTYTFRATASAAGADDIVYEIDFMVLPADFNADNTIVCYGDSITYGDGSDTVTIDDRSNYFEGRLNGKTTKAGYPYYLAGMINEKYNVINQSKPQQWSDTILAWAGGVDVVSRNDVTLPANGESVWAPTNLVFTAENPYGIDGGLQFVRDIRYPNDQTNYFAGVQTPSLPAVEAYPTPSGNYSSMTGWFGDKRVRVYGETAHPKITGKSTPDYGPDQSWARVSTSGSETVIPAGTPFVPDTALLYNDAISVIFAGTNDQLDRNTYNENRDPKIDHTTYIDMIAKTVSNIPSERYVVISTLSESARSDEIEAAFTEEFAEHHLNLYKMMKSCGLKVAVKLGLMTETEAAATTWNDKDGKGLMPEGDSIHPNNKGAQVVAYILKQKLIELKYIEGARDADVCFNFVAKPQIKGTYFEYDRTEKVVVEPGEGYTIVGVASAINPGVYNVTIMPNDGLFWEDGTRDAITVTWKIHADRTITPMEDRSWGYIVEYLGENYDEVARVYTNENATAMTWTIPENLANVQFLVVGGGGGGGAINNTKDTRITGAGGGGGGVVTGVVATLEKDATVTINIGKGGTAGKCAVDQYGGFGASENGGNSSFVYYADKLTVTAYGGGGDGGAQGTLESVSLGNAGKAGGSSGGSRPGCATKTAPLSTEDCVISQIDGLVVYSEAFGKAGGAGNINNDYGSYGWIAGGGGGATEPGGDGNIAIDWYGGKGGEGLASYITGVRTVYGSGGGGGSAVDKDGCGGVAGTGAGAGNATKNGDGFPALANQGGGGGGSGVASNGGVGGSGIVVFRYKNIVQIEKPVVSYPDGSKFTVTGDEQKPVITPAEGVGYTVTYEGDFTSTGSHKVIISLKPGYVWADGSYDNIEYSYEFIERTYTKYYNSKAKKSGSYQSNGRWVNDEAEAEKENPDYVSYPDSYDSHNICKYNSSAQLDNGLKPMVGKFTVSADYRVYAYSGGLKFENTTLTPVPLWENESGVSQVQGGFIELNGEGSGYFEIAGNATTEFSYVNASNNVFVLFSTTDATGSKLRFGQFEGKYITNLGWFEGGTSETKPTIEVENAVVNFYNPSAVNGVEGPLAIDVKLGPSNSVSEAVINVAGTLNINSGSTIAVDAGQLPGGMYPIITAATFNGADILLESSTVTGLADNTIGSLVLREDEDEDGKTTTIYLDIVYTDRFAPLPEAIEEDLVYDGSEKIGVKEDPLYILENHKKTDAGEYVATAIPAPGYTWEDGSRDALEIIWTIAKGYAIWSVEPSISPTSWTEGDETIELTYSKGNVDGVESSITITKGKDICSDYSLDEPKSWSKGNYVVTFTVPGDQNVAALTKSIAITVKPQAVYDPEYPNIVTTNAMDNAWGYIVNGLGSYGNEVALVFTNENATSMSWTVPQNLTDVEFLVVGGGGGGGGSVYSAGGAGGGAGAVAYGTIHFLEMNSEISVAVGKGGKGGTGTTSKTKGNGASEAGKESSVTVGETLYVKALGGGNDTGYDSSFAEKGGVGGSNAGNRPKVEDAQSAKNDYSRGEINPVVATGTLLGHIGGKGHTSERAAGGGGGAMGDGGSPIKGTNGSSTTSWTSGNGGAGYRSDITGTEFIYGAGGGAGITVYEGSSIKYSSGSAGAETAGNGGGGTDAAAKSPGGSALANFGGGGGGGGSGKYGDASSEVADGGNGGSGIVVIRYSLGDPVLGETILPITGPNGAPWGYTISGIGEFRDETAAVFTNENAKGMTWTAPTIFGENARFLVVAGGGGGGGAQSKWDGEEDTYIGGAGGGGGGVVTGLVDAVSIKGKTANITVGVGGIGGKAGTRGRRITFNYVTANGSVKRNVAAYGDVRKLATDSVFKFSDNTLVRAYAGGGDGGGQINNGTVVNKGFDGGSGAGMRIGYHLAPSKGTQGLITNNDGWLTNCVKFGCAGGSHGGFWYNASGGGGATQPGYGALDEFTGGYGGQGLASDITGELLVYGSGGGGATARGEGRGGVPGDGAGTGAYLYGKRYEEGDPAYGGNGLANQGGGGGGGGAWSDGGNGGSGIVAIRYKNMAGGTVVPDNIRAKILDLEYTGSSQVCNLTNTVGYTVERAEGTEVGTYQVTVTPNSGYLWEDGTTGAKKFDWKIVKAQNEWITEPSISLGTWVKGDPGGVFTPGVAKVGKENIVVTTNGVVKLEGTPWPQDVGLYEVKYTLAETESYTGLEKTVYYRVSSGVLTAVDKPFVSHPDGSMFFTNGEEQIPLVVPQPIDNPPAETGYTVTYEGDFKDVGQYTITVNLKDGYKWSDETVAPLVYRYSFVDRQFVNYYWGCDKRWGSEEYRSKEAGIWFTDEERTQNVSSNYWYSFVDGPDAGEYFEPDSYDALVWATIPTNQTEAVLDKRGLHPKIGKLYVDGYAKVLGSSLHYINESDEAIPYVVVTEGSTLEMWINHYYSDNGGLGFVDIAKGATVYARRAIADENIFVRFDEDNADGSSLIIGNAHLYMDKEWHNAFGWFEGGTEDTKPMIRIEPSLYGTLRFTNPDAVNGVAGPLTIEAAFHTKTKNMTLIDVAGDLVINPGSTLLVDAGQLDIGVYSVIDVKKSFVDDADLIRYGSVTNLKKGTYGTLVKSDDGKSINLHVTSGPIVNNKTVKPEDVYNTARISKPIYYPCNAHMFDEDNGDRVIRWGSTNVVVPVYYDPSFVGGAKTQIGVVFNEKATPKIVSTRDDEGKVTREGITIGEDGKVTVYFENTHRQLFYSLRTATSLDELRGADTLRDGLVTWEICPTADGERYITAPSGTSTTGEFQPAVAAPASNSAVEPEEVRLFSIQVFDETEAIPQN